MQLNASKHIIEDSPKSFGNVRKLQKTIMLTALKQTGSKTRSFFILVFVFGFICSLGFSAFNFSFAVLVFRVSWFVV